MIFVKKLKKIKDNLIKINQIFKQPKIKKFNRIILIEIYYEN